MLLNIDVNSTVVPFLLGLEDKDNLKKEDFKNIRCD